MIAVLLGFIAICLVSWLVLEMGWRTWVDIQMILGAPKRKPRDVSHLNLLPPPRTQEIMHTLESFGFCRLGEAGVVLPHHGLVHHWVLVSADGLVQAEVIGERVSFSTFFDEIAMVVTDYPRGEHIETPLYQAHTITTTIGDALVHHLQQIPAFTAKYGAPHLILSMKDYLHWESVGRVHYSRLKLRRFLLREIVRGVLCLYAFLIILGLPSVFKRGWLGVKTMAEIALIVLSLTWPVTVLDPRISLWMVRGGMRDSRVISNVVAWKRKSVGASLREVIKEEKKALEEEERKT